MTCFWLCAIFLLFLGVYFLFEASIDFKCRPARGVFVSPHFPRRFTGEAKCLRFAYNMYGKHTGTLRILDERGALIWESSDQTVLDEKSVWFYEEVTMSTSQRLFVVEIMRGQTSTREDKGDVAVDNLALIPMSCEGI